MDRLKNSTNKTVTIKRGFQVIDMGSIEHTSAQK
jgi:hypothetical protein